MLADYVTAIAWSPDGQTLAACDAAGEVMLWHSSTNQLPTLQAGNGASVDCIAFSRDGQFLAAGGQDGQVKIWRWREQELIATLENAPNWVDKLVWSPTSNQLAFSLGRYVQVWDANTSDIVVTLNFDTSSVLGIDWRPDGQYLAIAGYQGAKIWHRLDWDDDPYILDVPSASVVIAWSPDGKYLATGNMDRTITVLEWNNPHPWVMRGFSGKVRQLAWSEAKTQLDEPLLASSSIEGIVVWQKLADENLGWDSRILHRHTGVVQAIAFQPNSVVLASAAEDGWLCLWHKAKRLAQVIDNASDGLSCLAWHPQGRQLAAGSQNGELLVWSKATRGKGFAGDRSQRGRK
jgi:WD40 repeat protein